MLRCLQLEEIEQHLLGVTDLVNRYDHHNASFSSMLIDWLTKLESIFEMNRMGIASVVAANRGMVLSAGRGVIPNDIRIQGRMTRRKVQDAAVMHALLSTSTLTENSIEPDRERYRQAQEMAQRVIAVATAKSLLGDGIDISKRSEDECWSILCGDQDTHGGVIQIRSLVGKTDAMIHLSRALCGN